MARDEQNHNSMSLLAPSERDASEAGGECPVNTRRPGRRTRTSSRLCDLCFRPVICARVWLLLLVLLLLLALVAVVTLLLLRHLPANSAIELTSTASTQAHAKHEETEEEKQFPYRSVRLPKAVLPQVYNLSIRTDLESLNFSGEVTIELLVLKRTNFLVLHAARGFVDSYDVHSPGYPDVKVTHIFFHAHNEMMYLALDRSLLPGEKPILRITFFSALQQNLQGYYKSSYTDENGKTRYLATTHFEPTYARLAFPCFDEPEFKSRFQLRMRHARGLEALFNMPLEQRRTLSDSSIESVFQRTVPMSTYLVAFVVSDFVSISGSTRRGIKVSVFAPAIQKSQTRYALDCAVKILDFYEKFYNVAYPLPKQDMLAVPDFPAGAMENWGLITYRAVALLYDPHKSPASSRQRVATVVAHELAHQWFGNLVTMEWWNDLWLNEGFASFVEYLGVNAVEPEWQMMDQFQLESLQSALRLDSFTNSHPVSVPVHEASEIEEIFDVISYQKGSCLIKMLGSVVGDQLLTSALSAYLNKYTYRNARTTDLWDTVTQVSKHKTGIDVNTVMATWTDQMNYPLITSHEVSGSSSVKLSQSRFLLQLKAVVKHPIRYHSPFNYTWYVPVSYLTTANRRGLIWLNRTDGVLHLPEGHSLLKLNVGQSGFYRVMYSEVGWRRLTAQLNIDHTVLSPADRAGILDDAFALARSGSLRAEQLMGLTRYLPQEREYVPLQTASVNLRYMMSMLHGTQALQHLKQYIMRFVEPNIKQLGWSDSGKHLMKYLRSVMQAMAVECDHQPSIDGALRIFTNWTDYGIEVPVDLKSLVYESAVRHGGRSQWEWVWNKYLNETVVSEKRLLLQAASKTRLADLIQRLLSYSLDRKQVRSQDTVPLVAQIGRNPAGRVLAWRFIRQNWAEFVKRYPAGAFDMRRLLLGIASDFNTEFDYQEFEVFFNSTKEDLGGNTRISGQCLEKIRMNVDWTQRHAQSIGRWLAAEIGSS